MKRLIFLVIICSILLSLFAYAENTTVYDPDTLFYLPVYNGGTGSRPSISTKGAISLTMDESAIPFAPIEWGTSMDKVVRITDGHVEDNIIESEVLIAGIKEPLKAIFHFEENQLESVSILYENGIRKAGNLKSHPIGNALIQFVDDYFNTKDADKMMRYSGDAIYIYKSIISDVVLGYIPNGKKYDFGMIFYKASSFDNSIFQDASMYDVAYEHDGTIDYNANSTRNDQLNISEQYKMNVGFACGIIVFGSSVTHINTLPRFRLVFYYSANVEPKNVNMVCFEIDNNYYQFNIPERYIIRNFDSEHRKYTMQASIMIGYNNARFMNSLTSTENSVNVEVIGPDPKKFKIAFHMPEYLRDTIAEDWENYQSAGGVTPLYGFASDETEMIVS